MMYSTPSRRAAMIARSLSPPVCASSMVVIATVWVISGGKQSLLQNAGFTLCLFSDQTGSPVMPASTALFSTAERFAPMPPAGGGKQVHILAVDAGRFQAHQDQHVGDRAGRGEAHLLADDVLYRGDRRVRLGDPE